MLSPLVVAAAHVVLWHSYRAGEQRALDACVAAWNRAHAADDGATVEALALPYDGYAAKLEAAIPRGNGPDLFIGSHGSIGDWSHAALIEPLEGRLPATALDGFLDGTVAPLRDAGHLWGLPLAFKSVALFYRRDLVPRPPATTDELVALARATRGAGPPDRYALAYEAGDFFFHAAWLHGFGGRILGPSGAAGGAERSDTIDDRGAPALDSDAAVAALAFVADLSKEQLLPAEPTSVVATQLFNDGRAAMTIKGPWFLGEIAPGVPFGVAPLPIVSATGRPAAPLVTIEALFVPARSHDPDAALAFARWLAGPDGARIRAVDGRQTVADRAAWDDPRVAADPVLAAFRAQLAATVPTSNAPAMQRVWEPANQALRQVLRGALPPRQALAVAQRRVLDSLRTARPAPLLPFLLALSLAGLVAVAILIRRARAAGGWAAIRRQRAAYAYLLPAALALAVLVFVPFTVGAAMSLFAYDGARWTFVGARNFIDILGARDVAVTDPLSFYFTLAVTALWTVCNVALHTLVGVTLALLLRDPLLRLRGVYRVLLIVPWAIPNYITALIWKGLFHRQFGAINGLLVALGLTPISWFSRFWTAFIANVATNVWIGFPFMMVVTLGALSRIPKELEEAASLDGAGRLQRLRHVVLPLLGPALVPAIALGAVWTFNMFNIVFLVSGGEPDGATDILVSQAYRWAFTRGHRYGYAAAYAVLIFAILSAQTLLQRPKPASLP